VLGSPSKSTKSTSIIYFQGTVEFLHLCSFWPIHKILIVICELSVKVSVTLVFVLFMLAI
jgi:hypothetical protein